MQHMKPWGDAIIAGYPHEERWCLSQCGTNVGEEMRHCRCQGSLWAGSVMKSWRKKQEKMALGIPFQQPLMVPTIRRQKEKVYRWPGSQAQDSESELPRESIAGEQTWNSKRPLNSSPAWSGSLTFPQLGSTGHQGTGVREGLLNTRWCCNCEQRQQQGDFRWWGEL